MDSVSFHAMCWLQVSRRCPWRFYVIFKSKQPVPVQPSKRAFEGVRTPNGQQCLEASALQLSKRPSYTVRTLSQATPSSTQSWISNDTIWEGSARHPDDVATRPDATQCSIIFWVSYECRKEWQHWPSGRSVKPFGRSPILGRIALFWKGGRRRPSGRS